MSLYEDLTSFFTKTSLFFLHDFWSVIRLFGELDLLRANIFGGKKKGKTSRRSGLGMDTHNICGKIHGLSLKTAWTFRLSCEKRVHFS